MPISPRCGSTWWMRQRKSCASSVEVGALKPATRTLIGLRPPRACLTVPSLPEASMPCSTTSTARRCSAISIVASSAMRSSALRGLLARGLLVAQAELGAGRMVGEVDLGAGLDARGAVRDPASRGRYAKARDGLRDERGGARCTSCANGSSDESALASAAGSSTSRARPRSPDGRLQACRAALRSASRASRSGERGVGLRGAGANGPR